MKKKLALLLIHFVNMTITHAQWQLSGNSILSTDFLGSTNAQPLAFKVNNTKAGLLDYDAIKANTAFGYQALLSNTGTRNTAVGHQALYSNSNGIRNTATGRSALFSNTTGAFNVGNGCYALQYNTTGQYNTAIGDYALNRNSSGHFNTATGAVSLFNNSSGLSNTANGLSALYANTTGNNNTAFGRYALHSNTTTNDLTAYGHYALFYNSTGIENTAIGHEALFSNTAGSYNTAIGFEALHSNTTGSHNTAIGPFALTKNTSGSYNTALAISSLFKNTGGMNTAIGDYATIFLGSTGTSITAIGRNVLEDNTTGWSNTGVGHRALDGNSSGSNNTALGYNANGGSGPPNNSMFNCTLIGHTAGGTNGGNNKVCIGNTSVTSIKGQVNFSTYSDERFKTKIQPLLHGLDFINRLKPITYTVDIDRLNHLIYGSKSDTLFADESMKKSIEANSKIIYSGFSAQQVEQVALDLSYNFSGVDKPENPDISPYGLRYSEFIVPLVKAVQELSIQHDSLQSDNQELQLQINALEQRVTALEAAYNKTLSQSLLITSNGVLKQNAPNPFNSNTTIRYYIPPDTKNAQIMITDMVGRNLKTIKVSGNGSGQINIAAGSLPAGNYVYSLAIEGKKVDSKQMVLTK
jgi:hypothetical protein